MTPRLKSHYRGFDIVVVGEASSGSAKLETLSVYLGTNAATEKRFHSEDDAKIWIDLESVKRKPGQA